MVAEQREREEAVEVKSWVRFRFWDEVTIPSFWCRVDSANV